MAVPFIKLGQVNNYEKFATYKHFVKHLYMSGLKGGPEAHKPNGRTKLN